MQSAWYCSTETSNEGNEAKRGGGDTEISTRRGMKPCIINYVDRLA